MKSNMLCRFIIMLIALMALILSAACRTPIEDADIGKSAEQTQPTVLHNPDARPVQNGNIKYTFEGSYLTGINSKTSLEFPYAKKFELYYEVESYYYYSEQSFFYGARFTLACASFADDYLKDNDVIMLVISDPSIYSSFISKGIEIINGTTVFKLERHLPEEAPEHDGIAYHLIFTAPKGSFSDIDCNNIEVQIAQVIDPEIEDVYDAEHYRYVYPEFWPFSYSADPLTKDPAVIVNTMETYEELLSFYESCKTSFDLDKEFLSSIGTLYDEYLFNDYIVMAAILPYDIRKNPAAVYDVFVYNLNVWLSVSNHGTDIPSQFIGWRLVTVAVAKKDLEGIKLKEFFIES